MIFFFTKYQFNPGQTFCQQPQADFHGQLQKLSRSLAPPCDYLRVGREVAHEIFECLKQNGYEYGLVVGRTKIAGSVGKGTAIAYRADSGMMVYPDFDLVVFVNDLSPPFRSVLDHFIDLLEQIPNLRNTSKTKISIKLIYRHPTVGDIKFDLLPAENHTVHTAGVNDVAQLEGRLSLRQVTITQLNSLLRGHEIDSNENRLRSSGLCENSIKFIQKWICADEFTLSLVRLAKFWNANINLGNTHVSARSSMIELIAIDSQRGRKSDNLFWAFERFLMKMGNMSSLVITLGCTKELQQIGVSLSKYLPSGHPVILNPCNPFENFAKDLQPEVMRAFEYQATETLRMLRRWATQGRYGRVENPIDDIFRHKIYGRKCSRHR